MLLIYKVDFEKYILYAVLLCVLRGEQTHTQNYPQETILAKLLNPYTHANIIYYFTATYINHTVQKHPFYNHRFLTFAFSSLASFGVSIPFSFHRSIIDSSTFTINFRNFL